MVARTVLVDDLDATEGATTRDFALDGVTYEIDLVDKNAAKLKKALEPFITAGRKISGPSRRRVITSRRPSPSPTGGTVQKNAIREWARANGKKVSDRGRVPRDVQDAFDKAHSAPAAKKTPAAAK